MAICNIGLKYKLEYLYLDEKNVNFVIDSNCPPKAVLRRLFNDRNMHCGFSVHSYTPLSFKAAD